MTITLEETLAKIGIDEKIKELTQKHEIIENFDELVIRCYDFCSRFLEKTIEPCIASLNSHLHNQGLKSLRFVILDNFSGTKIHNYSYKSFFIQIFVKNSGTPINLLIEPNFLIEFNFANANFTIKSTDKFGKTISRIENYSLNDISSKTDDNLSEIFLKNFETYIDYTFKNF